MTEDEEKKYLSSLNKIIKSGNLRFVSYISKEYVRNLNSNPQIALAIACMIQKESTEDKSVYGIFIDPNGSINLDAMIDISKLTNIDEFVGTVQDLTEFDIDFSELTADELIIEGEKIADELAREAENIESEISNMVIDEDTDITSVECEAVSKANDIASKVVGIAVIGGTVAAVLSRIKSVIGRITIVLGSKKNEQEEVKSEKKTIIKEDDSFCPKVKIDVARAIEENEREVKKKQREIDEGGITDDVDDNPADDFLDF